ncbi:hypothetical protein EDB80DRAFT_698466, partial [Ilyonectria destructans]
MYTIYVLSQVLLFLTQHMQDTSYPHPLHLHASSPRSRTTTRRTCVSSPSPCFSRRHCTFHRRLGSVYFILRASCRLI